MFRRGVLAFSVLLVPSTVWANPHPDGGVTKAALVKAAPANPVATAAKPVAGKPASGNTAPAKRGKKPSRYASVELYGVNTKETLMLRFQDDGGKPIKGWQKRFDRFMRCHQTGAVHRMDQRLAHMLYQTARHYEGHRLEVVSGYRHPRVAKNPKSPHKQGLACDFRIPGVANAALRDFLRKTFDHAGVGYYPNSVFVHLDNRKSGPSAFWIDYSGPGEAASYAENPNEDLRNGRADRARSREEDAAGRAEGADDMALSGEGAVTAAKPRVKVKLAVPAAKPPVEIKPSNPFGD